MNFAPEKIEQLEVNDVFVFGSNKDGFHGAGSAGFAMYGSGKNLWRVNTEFQVAMKGPDKRGRWAVLGVGRGYQEGKIGKSYAIQTVEAPGKQGNVTLGLVFAQMLELNAFAKANPNLRFLCVPFGMDRASGGFAYFSETEIIGLWKELIRIGLAKNIYLPKRFEPALRELDKQQEFSL